MTTSENVGKAYMLSEVEKQIRKDIPRLMELREGCLIKDSISWSVFKVTRIEGNRISFGAYDGLISSVRHSEEEINSIERKKIDKFFTIIGHDIMLNDVLAWLNHIIYEKCIPINDLGYSGMVKQFYVKGDDGSIIFEILDLKNPDLGLDTIRYGVWDLSSIYLKDQQERLIKFLYNLKKE